MFFLLFVIRLNFIKKTGGKIDIRLLLAMILSVACDWKIGYYA